LSSSRRVRRSRRPRPRWSKQCSESALQLPRCRRSPKPAPYSVASSPKVSPCRSTCSVPSTAPVGDTPDFVASAAVFSYVFTLRGDKAWKQPPATNGALKVSHLALATHEALSQRGALSAYDLTTELGKEVTEAAVLRALNELWTHLRVLPLPQPDGLPALWELAPARFTKQIKAGANAGQPSALSALISLYLGQALVAAEDEIESFLSPLAPRSRIRDVIHTLLSARQLDTLAIEGRTLLHVAGELPAFLAAEPSLAAPEMQAAPGSEIAPETDATNAAQIEASVGIEATAGETPARITKFIPKPRKIGTGYLAKAKPIAPGSGFKPRFKPGSGPPPDRERRPFRKPPAKFNQPAAFNKPWEEEKAKRLAAARKPSEVSDDAGDLAASGIRWGRSTAFLAPHSAHVQASPAFIKPVSIAPGGTGRSAQVCRQTSVPRQTIL
jgi:23S rRNA pseudouridine2605 synthase